MATDLILTVRKSEMLLGNVQASMTYLYVTYISRAFYKSTQKSWAVIFPTLSRREK